MKKGIDPEEFAMKLNILRVKVEFRRRYSQDEIIRLLKNYGLPCSIAYFGAYVKHNVIIRVERGTYQFPEEPVYKGLIETALESVRKYKLNNAKKQFGKAEQEQVRKKEAEYIQFLKERGYIIYKQM